MPYIEPIGDKNTLSATGQDQVYDPETKDVDDLGLAASLMLFGIEPVNVRRISYSKVMFEFPNTAEVRFYDDAYFRDECPVNARDFWKKLREIKSMTQNV